MERRIFLKTMTALGAAVASRAHAAGDAMKYDPKARFEVTAETDQVLGADRRPAELVDVDAGLTIERAQVRAVLKDHVVVAARIE